MYGRHMGSFEILYRKNGGETDISLVKISGDQGRQWKMKQLTIVSDRAFKVRRFLVNPFPQNVSRYTG
jgi:hypothetical protein